MHLQNIQLINFKNYVEAQLDFSADVNVFVGDNGVGKTNMLDAIYYLSFSKSYLNPQDRHSIKLDENFFLIKDYFSRILK